MPIALFIFLAAVSLISALGVVVQKNPIHCLLSLILTLITIGALFVALDAVTVGFLQIIVYVGAIMVLFLFVIWLLNLQAEALPIGHLGLKFFATIAVSALAAEIFAFMARTKVALRAGVVAPGYGSIDSLAQTLFGQYLMAFETTSVLLLVAVVGAVAVARRSGPERIVAPKQEAS